MFSPALFHSRLSAVCKANATTITKFAKDVLHVSSSAPTNWKNGMIPGADAVARSAEHFGITADYLLGLSNTPISTTDTEFSQQEYDLLAKLSAAPPQARKTAEAAMDAVLRSFPAQDETRL